MSPATAAVWSSSSPLFKYSIHSRFPKNILPDFHCLHFKPQAHCKSYAIHMSVIHFSPVHQNAVFVLNVKMPFVSLFMSPLRLLFLNDGRTCFAKFKIHKSICNFVPNTSFWESSLCLLLGKLKFSDIGFWSLLYVLKTLLAFILNVLMNVITYVSKRKSLENQTVTHRPLEGKPCCLYHFTLSASYLDD